MQHTPTVQGASFKDLVPVRSIEALGLMVKEAEMLTGKPGRDFVVVGADRVGFHVELDPHGVQLARIGDAEPIDPTFVFPWDLTKHTLGNAMACGLLYTPAIQ